MSIQEIAREIGVSSPTAKKYINNSFKPENPQSGEPRNSMLKPYTSTIDIMLRERRKFKGIESATREAGYKGAASTIRMYATRQRRIIKAVNAEAIASMEPVERKRVTKLLYQPIKKVCGITERQVESIVREYPVIGQLYDTARSFKGMMFAKRVDELDG